MDIVSNFYNLESFLPKILLEKNADIITQEVLNVPVEQMLPWHEKEIFKGGWFLQPILLTDISFQNEGMPLNKTLEILKSLDCIQAGISVLNANTNILPHTDNVHNDVLLSKKLYRLQLGISIPDNCTLTVDNSYGEPECRAWENGKVLAFDSSKRHSANNLSNEKRIVLIADFKREDVEVFEEEIIRLKHYYLNLYGVV